MITSDDTSDDTSDETIVPIPDDSSQGDPNNNKTHNNPDGNGSDKKEGENEKSLAENPVLWICICLIVIIPIVVFLIYRFVIKKDERIILIVLELI